jgi:hypothetical protein
MPSTQYTVGETPSKASMKTPQELRTEYGQRRRRLERPIFPGDSIYDDVQNKKNAIIYARKPENFFHSQNELFKLLEQDPSVDLDHSVWEKVNTLMDRARYRQKLADNTNEQSIMNDQLEFREGQPLRDATCMSILQFVSRSVARDSADPLCLTKARDYCTPSVKGEVYHLLGRSPCADVHQRKTPMTRRVRRS